MKIIKKLSVTFLTSCMLCSCSSYDIKEDDYFFKPINQEPLPKPGINEYHFQAKQQTYYPILNCVSYNLIAYWGSSNEKVDAPYTIIISKSLLKKLSRHKDNHKSKNYALGRYADIMLNNLEGFDRYGCQKVKTDESKNVSPEVRNELAFANAFLFKEAILAGETTIIDKNRNIQPIVNIRYFEGADRGDVDFSVGKTQFFGTMWYVR